MALTAPLAYALDNPEAPDYVAEFQQRARPFENNFDKQTSIYDTSQAGVAYAKFLDKELNQAYQSLLKKLDDPKAREQLRKSQRAWLTYYQAETNFIWTNWVTTNFGSSYELSRQSYRNALVKERIEVLLNYLRNY
jgi:uncharacterized protein YecT (DUF1311 family)